MNRTEALNVLRPQGNSLNDLKSAYRAACKKYHPDINPHGLELMKVINTAYAFLKKNMDKWSHNQQTDDISITEVLQEVFDKIKHFVNIESEVCGSWLWVSGETWRYKKELKAAGLRWAPKKHQWYWRPEGYRKKSRRVLSMGEIRTMFGSVEMEQEQLAALG